MFDKPIGRHWVLRKQAHATLHHPVGRGVYFDTHALCNLRTGQAIGQPAWEWAEIDGGRLVWAADGCLHVGSVTAQGLADSKVLHDFRPMRFEALAAPY